MRYFFHVIGADQSIVDDDGTDFPSTELAIGYGTRVAVELGGDGEYDGCDVVIIGEGQKELARIPI